MRRNKAIERLEHEVRRALQEDGLAGGTARKSIVVAVSGGTDSLAMLLALSRISGDLGLMLNGAHLDHGLRGEESQADADFVAETFRELGIKFTIEQADVRAFQKKHRLSLEEAAREVRYAFLAHVAAEQRADAVSLGHTSDDQAETVLMHIIRGSGLTGLQGMESSARRIIGGSEVLLVRPLLRLSREDTALYCRALNLEPRQDSSNLSTELMRNHVRMELLPLLETHNPAVRQALVRLSRDAARQVAFLGRQVNDVWRDAVCQEQDRVSLRKDVFNRLAPPLQAHLLRRAVALIKGDMNGIEQVHVDGMAHLMEGRGGTSLDLPGGIRFSMGYDEATIAAADSDQCPLPPLKGEHSLTIPGETEAGHWHVVATVRDGERAKESSFVPQSPRGRGKLVAHLSYEALGRQVFTRTRRPGDRFQPLGMARLKKLQDFMVDAKIPREWRDRVPLVVSPQGIAWVVGWRIADWARVGSKEPRALQLGFEPRGWPWV